jgi:Putative polyhydroxyalkanoic acid system protein (PHA_gran_rgn)
LKIGLDEVGTRFGHLFSIREQTWTADHLHFQVSAVGQLASGSVDVEDDCVRLNVSLPWFLARLIGTVQPLIRKEGKLLLEKK